jgi:predicted TIM-barrel fold metal-dependent hydrolase
MFASHLPICRLAGGFGRLYAAYLEIVADFSPPEQRRLLHDTAAAVYGLQGAHPAPRTAASRS